LYEVKKIDMVKTDKPGKPGVNKEIHLKLTDLLKSKLKLIFN
jgi:hypothetical protein